VEPYWANHVAKIHLLRHRSSNVTDKITQRRGNVSHGPFEQDLERNRANYVPLSPLSFLKRTAAVYPHRPAII